MGRWGDQKYFVSLDVASHHTFLIRSNKKSMQKKCVCANTYPAWPPPWRMPALVVVTRVLTLKQTYKTYPCTKFMINFITRFFCFGSLSDIKRTRATRAVSLNFRSLSQPLRYYEQVRYTMNTNSAMRLLPSAQGFSLMSA